MTEAQRQLARHALGFPNRQNRSYRNSFCTGPGSVDYPEWQEMVAHGEAIRRDGSLWGGDSMFHLVLNAALSVREPKESLSQEDVATMRTFETAEGVK
jgi:hypothetical protein